MEQIASNQMTLQITIIRRQSHDTGLAFSSLSFVLVLLYKSILLFVANCTQQPAVILSVSRLICFLKNNTRTIIDGDTNADTPIDALPY